MNQLHVATLPAEKIGHPEDGEYVWISLDGERFYEVNRAPTVEEEAEWIESLKDMTSPDRREARISIHARMLNHYGAKIVGPAS